MSTDGPKAPVAGEKSYVYLCNGKGYVKVEACAIDAWNAWMDGLFGWSKVNQAYVCDTGLTNEADYWRLIKEKQD